jgi:hypothetical protein
VRTATIHERKDRSVVEQNATMPGAAGSLAFRTGKRYHDRRADIAECGIGDGMEAAAMMRTR